MAIERKYEIELWWRNKTKIMEIGREAQNIKWSKTLNGVYSVDFKINSQYFLEKCKRLGLDPTEVLQAKNSEVKVKRRGEYIMGAFLNDFPDPEFGQLETMISLAFDGYLNLLEDQTINRGTRYDQMDTTEIAWNIVDMQNKKEGSTLGITKSDQWVAAGMLRDREYDDNQIVKNCLVNLTALGDGQNDFDFEFDAFRRFKTWRAMGEYKPEVVLSYPMTVDTIPVQKLEYEYSSDMANYIIAKGSGFGDEVLTYKTYDVNSIAKYGVHEKVISYNDISRIETLTEHAEAELSARKEPIILPKLTVNGAHFDLNKHKLGDVINFRNLTNPIFDVIDTYRIYKLDVSLDKNMDETITITLASYKLPGA